VINANPNSPPYSIVYLARRLEKSYKNARASLKYHVHSSYRKTLDKTVLETLECFNREVDGANLKFTIIWKDGECMRVCLFDVLRYSY
jgi:hypothetical protein